MSDEREAFVIAEPEPIVKRQNLEVVFRLRPKGES